MRSEIIYVCNSTNNKNVREGELEILRKYEEQLCFEFGESEMNIKKRFYNDLETLNKDFNALLKLKNKEIKEEYEEVANEEFRSVPVFEEKEQKVEKKISKKRFNKKNNSLF